MKNLKTTLLKNLIEKELFFLHKNNSFFVLNFYSVLQHLKQFLQLKSINKSIVIVTTNRQYRYLLKKYIFNKFLNVFIVNNTKSININNSLIIYLDFNLNHISYQNQNLTVIINQINDFNLYNCYKIFMQLSELKNLIVFIALLRRLLEKI